jgi:hypothetical protein
LKSERNSFKFGKEVKRSMKEDESPGPGFYKIPCRIAEVPRYVLPKQNEKYKFV